MVEFSRETALRAVDIIREALNKVGEDNGYKVILSRGTYKDDEITIRVKVKLLDEGGEVIVGGSTNKLADKYAERNLISYSTPHFIGSIWRISGSIAKVVGFNSRNRKYPVLVEVDGVIKKASDISFREELSMPLFKDFKVWYTIDPEDDRLTATEEITYDRVEEYMDAMFGKSPLFDEFMDECERHLLKNFAIATGVAENIYKKLFLESTTNPLEEVISFQKQIK